MSTICSCGACAASCEEHSHFSLLEAKDEYWSSPPGIVRRIKFLAQDFTYKSVNNAMKIYGDTKGVKWLKWETKEDDRVCVICQTAANGGWSGYYKVSWFMPQMPAHPGCRCQWQVYYDPIEVQQTLT